MKLAISNIAWPEEHDGIAAGLLATSGFGGIEIAPTRVWSSPLDVTPGEASEYRRRWTDRGLQIVAMQALLFGRPDLTLFESSEQRSATLDYLRGLGRLAATLGAAVLVFGAPRNRRVGSMDRRRAEEIAVGFFRAAGGHAREQGVVLAIEPNPVEYACDFVTTSGEGLDLVRKVAEPGFGLHLDAAALTLAKEPLEDAIVACSGAIRHFHVSEPQLGPVGQGGVDHETLASALRKVHYPNWVSVEMRYDPQKETGPELERVLRFVSRTFGD